MKKSSSTVRQSISPQSQNRVSKGEDQVLLEIKKKISNSAALNGGFDTLLYKIDKIEQGQGQLVLKVDKIHDAIYDPNDGIFSKLSSYKLENSEKINEIASEVNEINVWKKHREKDEEKDDKIVENTTEKVVLLEKDVHQLVKSKNTMWSFLKWFGVAIGGGIITLIFGWLQSKIK